jgi:hypothetical protein
MIIKNLKKYDGSLIHKRFAYEYFRKKTLPIGNIVAFRGEMDVTTNLIDSEDLLNNDYIHSEDAINFCWEIPNLDAFGAVAFQRLFNTYIANILSSKYLKKPIEVDGDDLMVHDEFEGSDGSLQKIGKCSVSITYSKNNVTLGHTGINIDAGRKAPNFAYSTKLTDEQAEQFMKDVIDVFYATVDDIFTATTKVIV